MVDQFWIVVYVMREPGEGDELDHGRVQGVGGVHRGRAALDVVHLRTLVGDDQRPLELAHVLGVDPEVGLQRHLHLHAGRDVDERATRPHGRVEGGELVVVGRDDLAEPLAHDVGVLAHGGVHVAEEDALGLEVLAVAVEDDLGLVLRGHAGEVLALGLGDPELLVRVLDGVGQVLPLVDLPARRLDVVVDVVEVEVRACGSANHGAIGLRSKCLRERSRKSRIQSGSPFISDISRTMDSFRPFLGLKT